MNEKEFINGLYEYLESEKVFVKNKTRFTEIEHATEIANKLFADSKVILEDDPLQMGSIILKIEGFDIIIRGKREIELFQELIDKADNFEIYAAGTDVKFAIMFHDALIRIKQGK